MILKGKIQTKVISLITFVLCLGSDFAFPNNDDYSKYESWCEKYINTYEVRRDSGVVFPALMDVPRELNDYLIESARKGDFRLLKYAATIALIMDAEVSKVSVTSVCLEGMGAENNGFVMLLLKSSEIVKDFDSLQDEDREDFLFIFRVRSLGDLVRENSIKLSKEDYDYVQEKFIAYLKRKNYVINNDCSKVLHVSDTIVFKINPCDKIKKIEFETLDYIDMDCAVKDLEKCSNLEDIEIKHPKYGENGFYTKDGILYYGSIFLFYPPKKREKIIELPNDVSKFEAKNNPYIQEIRFTHSYTDDFSVNISNCKNIKKITTPKKLLYMKSNSSDCIGGKNIRVNENGDLNYTAERKGRVEGERNEKHRNAKKKMK